MGKIPQKYKIHRIKYCNVYTTEPMPNKQIHTSEIKTKTKLLTNQDCIKENGLHSHSLDMKHNKLPKYSKRLTPEYPSEQSIP
jgi:hypothetical protein